MKMNIDIFSCQDKYLPMGDKCVHQNKLIAITCSIGGALIIGLIIGLVVMGVNKKKYMKR